LGRPAPLLARLADVLIVKPETVISWHRGFRLFWRWRLRARGGRPKITAEIRGLIRRLAQENADWGAPKIHGELLKLGFHVSERTSLLICDWGGGALGNFIYDRSAAGLPGLPIQHTSVAKS
jgi:hypothetical protein